MAKVEQKQPIVAEISEAIKDAASIVLVTYSGITVEQDTAMRKELREAGVSYKVYKNTMMNFAFKGTPCEELCKHLEGPNAIAISKDDATAPARILAKYAKDVKALKLVAGVVEDAYYDEAGITALSSIPSREELLGKLLGSIQSPIANFARVISRYIEHEVGRSFEQKGDHRSEEGAYVNHHVVDAEPNGGCFIRCGLGNRGRDDRFEQGGTQSQVKVHEEYSRERGEHG